MLSAFVLASLLACAPQVATIKFDQATVTVNSLDAIDIQKAKLMDAKGKEIVDAKQKPSITVSTEAVAKLDGPKLKPLANGETTVVATLGKVKGQYQLIVAIPDKITLQGYTPGTPIAIGSNVILRADVLAGNKAITPTPTIEWKTADDKIATVVNGKVTGVGTGATTITAISGKLEAKLDVTVGEAPVTGLRPGIEVSKTLKPADKKGEANKKDAAKKDNKKDNNKKDDGKKKTTTKKK